MVEGRTALTTPDILPGILDPTSKGIALSIGRVNIEALFLQDLVQHTPENMQALSRILTTSVCGYLPLNAELTTYLAGEKGDVGHTTSPVLYVVATGGPGSEGHALVVDDHHYRHNKEMFGEMDHILTSLGREAIELTNRLTTMYPLSRSLHPDAIGYESSIYIG